MKSKRDDIFMGAAALTFFLLLSIFPAIIFLFSVLPYLPIDNLEKSILDFVSLAWPKEATVLFSEIIDDVMASQDLRIVSLSFLAAVWTASSGMYAIMRQLNKIFYVEEARSFLKGRMVAIFMTVVFGVQVLSAFSLIVFGGVIQNFFVDSFSYHKLFFFAFEILRWTIGFFSLLLGFALIYHYGPNIKRSFSLFRIGNIVAVMLLVSGSIVFRYYIENFAHYATTTYGSLGAVIILMLWLYMASSVLLFGSEINFLVEKQKLAAKGSKKTLESL
ncbi:MAG: YihY/virulence factor BrkB family protein [Bdellovibrionales bacterium]|nr:YihY/virulence factor BrkB family protein [Bdellovibrionales bacterium]